MEIRKYTTANNNERERERNKVLNPEENIRVKQKELPQVASHNKFI